MDIHMINQNNVLRKWKFKKLGYVDYLECINMPSFYMLLFEEYLSL